MLKIALTITAAAVLSASAFCSQVLEADRAEEKNLILLKNAHAVVGVLPHAGGRVVLYRLVDGANVLHSDPAKWTEAPESAPSPEAFYQFYNGHTCWVSPQSQWWTQQDVNTARRDAKAVWPPDPYLELSPCRIIKQTKTELRIELPKSPICGLTLIKSVRLNDDGSVSLSVKGTNARKSSVAWGLWSNTRLPGTMTCYVPLNLDTEAATSIRIEGNLTGEIRDRFFFFQAKDVSTKGKYGKAFIQNPTGGMFAFGKNLCFVKSVQPAGSKEVHPSQAPVEIYQNIDPHPNAQLLELENHGEYERLNSGESISIEETWQLLHYAGPADFASHIRFMRETKLPK